MAGLGRYDWSTWKLALSAHGPLDSAQRGGYMAGYESLLPLGNAQRVKSFVERLVTDQEAMLGGDLPRIYYVPVTGSDTPLALPLGLPPEAGALFETVAGVGGVASLAQLAGSLETMGRTAQAVADREEELRETGLEEDAIREQIRREGVDEDTTEATTCRGALEGFLRSEDGGGMSEREAEETADELILEASRQGVGAGREGMTSAQRAGAVAATASALLDSIMGAVSNADDATGLAIAGQVLSAIGEACMSLGAVLSGAPVAGAILLVVGLLCELIGRLLTYFRGYGVSAGEGYNQEWTNTDGILILRDRVAVLAHCDCEALEVGNLEAFQRMWSKLHSGKSRNQWEAEMHAMVVATARSHEDRFDNARALCRAFGGREADVSHQMIDEIVEWLLYIGCDSGVVGHVGTWLREARMMTVTIQRRRKISQLKDSEFVVNGSKRWWRDEDKISDYHARDCNMSNCRCGSDSSRYDSKPNLFVGTDNSFGNTPGWYEACIGLEEHQEYTLDDLRNLWLYLQTRLKIVPSVPKGTNLSFVAGEGWEVSGTQRFGIRDDWTARIVELRTPYTRETRYADGRVFSTEGELVVRASPGLARTDIGYGRDSHFQTVVGDVAWGVMVTWTYPGASLDPATGRQREWSVYGGADMRRVWQFVHRPEFLTSLRNQLASAGAGGGAGAIAGLAVGAAVIGGLILVAR
jgi:hypothetical protein